MRTILKALLMTLATKLAMDFDIGYLKHAS